MRPLAYAIIYRRMVGVVEIIFDVIDDHGLADLGNRRRLRRELTKFGLNCRFKLMLWKCRLIGIETFLLKPLVNSQYHRKSNIRSINLENKLGRPKGFAATAEAAIAIHVAREMKTINQRGVVLGWRSHRFIGKKQLRDAIPRVGCRNRVIVRATIVHGTHQPPPLD